MSFQSGGWSLCYFLMVLWENNRLMFVKYLNEDTTLVLLFFLKYIWSLFTVTLPAYSRIL